MTSVRVERLDHLGLIASTIKDLGLIDMIDARLAPDEQEVLTPGEAVAGMILDSLGFAKKPLTLTPQFFANKPLDLLFRQGVHAEMCNRFKLCRMLDERSLRMVVMCSSAHWPSPSVPTKALIRVPIISTPPVLPSTATMCLRGRSRPFTSPMAMPKIIGQT